MLLSWNPYCLGSLVSTKIGRFSQRTNMRHTRKPDFTRNGCQPSDSMEPSPGSFPNAVPVNAHAVKPGDMRHYRTSATDSEPFSRTFRSNPAAGNKSFLAGLASDSPRPPRCIVDRPGSALELAGDTDKIGLGDTLFHARSPGNADLLAAETSGEPPRDNDHCSNNGMGDQE